MKKKPNKLLLKALAVVATAAVVIASQGTALSAAQIGKFISGDKTQVVNEKAEDRKFHQSGIKVERNKIEKSNHDRSSQFTEPEFDLHSIKESMEHTPQATDTSSKIEMKDPTLKDTNRMRLTVIAFDLYISVEEAQNILDRIAAGDQTIVEEYTRQTYIDARMKGVPREPQLKYPDVKIVLDSLAQIKAEQGVYDVLVEGVDVKGRVEPGYGRMQVIVGYDNPSSGVAAKTDIDSTIEEDIGNIASPYEYLEFFSVTDNIVVDASEDLNLAVNKIKNKDSEYLYSKLKPKIWLDGDQKSLYIPSSYSGEYTGNAFDVIQEVDGVKPEKGVYPISYTAVSPFYGGDEILLYVTSSPRVVMGYKNPVYSPILPAEKSEYGRQRKIPRAMVADDIVIPYDAFETFNNLSLDEKKEFIIRESKAVAWDPEKEDNFDSSTLDISEKDIDDISEGKSVEVKIVSTTDEFNSKRKIEYTINVLVEENKHKISLKLNSPYVEVGSKQEMEEQILKDVFILDYNGLIISDPTAKIETNCDEIYYDDINDMGLYKVTYHGKYNGEVTEPKSRVYAIGGLANIENGLAIFAKDISIRQNKVAQTDKEKRLQLIKESAAFAVELEKDEQTGEVVSGSRKEISEVYLGGYSNREGVYEPLYQYKTSKHSIQLVRSATVVANKKPIIFGEQIIVTKSLPTNYKEGLTAVDEDGEDITPYITITHIDMSKYNEKTKKGLVVVDYAVLDSLNNLGTFRRNYIITSDTAATKFLFADNFIIDIEDVSETDALKKAQVLKASGAFGIDIASGAVEITTNPDDFVVDLGGYSANPGRYTIHLAYQSQTLNIYGDVVATNPAGITVSPEIEHVRLGTRMDQIDFLRGVNAKDSSGKEDIQAITIKKDEDFTKKMGAYEITYEFKDKLTGKEYSAKRLYVVSGTIVEDYIIFAHDFNIQSDAVSRGASAMKKQVLKQSEAYAVKKDDVNGVKLPVHVQSLNGYSAKKKISYPEIVITGAEGVGERSIAASVDFERYPVSDSKSSINAASFNFKERSMTWDQAVSLSGVKAWVDDNELSPQNIQVNPIQLEEINKAAKLQMVTVKDLTFTSKYAGIGVNSSPVSITVKVFINYMTDPLFDLETGIGANANDFYYPNAHNLVNNLDAFNKNAKPYVWDINNPIHVLEYDFTPTKMIPNEIPKEQSIVFPFKISKKGSSEGLFFVRSVQGYGMKNPQDFQSRIADKGEVRFIHNLKTKKLTEQDIEAYENLIEQNKGKAALKSIGIDLSGWGLGKDTDLDDYFILNKSQLRYDFDSKEDPHGDRSTQIYLYDFTYGEDVLVDLQIVRFDDEMDDIE